jgi:hypothetical protein
MEAKVDIRRLQYLNDRIAQVTDALNQVRLSVHGLSPALGFAGPQYGFQPQPGFQQFPGFPQLPYGMGPIGLQHAPFPGLQSQGQFGPFGWQTGFQSPMLGGLGAQGFHPQMLGGLGLQQGFQPQTLGGLGLQHAPYGGYPPYPMPGIQGIAGIQGQAQQGGGWGSQAWSPFAGGGLYHSPIELMEQRLSEQRAADPNRILQTFPLALVPLTFGG